RHCRLLPGGRPTCCRGPTTCRPQPAAGRRLATGATGSDQQLRTGQTRDAPGDVRRPRRRAERRPGRLAQWRSVAAMSRLLRWWPRPDQTAKITVAVLIVAAAGVMVGWQRQTGPLWPAPPGAPTTESSWPSTNDPTSPAPSTGNMNPDPQQSRSSSAPAPIPTVSGGPSAKPASTSSPPTPTRSPTTSSTSTPPASVPPPSTTSSPTSTATATPSSTSPTPDPTPPPSDLSPPPPEVQPDPTTTAATP